MEQESNYNNSTHQVWTPLRMEDLKPETRQQVLKVIEKIPELPLSVGKIIELADDDNSSLPEFVRLISSDPGLVSNILKVVNSSYYGLRYKTDNLQLAVVLLGFKEVRKIAVQSFFRRMVVDSPVQRQYTNQLWIHSYLVSICAESLCPPDDQQKRGVYLTLGLLHDIGKYVLFSMSRKTGKGAYSGDEGNSAEKKYTLEREEFSYHINHALTGSLLIEKWNLSERFLSVLQYHHAPSFCGVNEIPRKHFQEIAAICIADLLVNRYMGTDELPSPHPHFFELAGFEPSLEQLLTEDRIETLEKARAFLTFLH